MCSVAVSLYLSNLQFDTRMLLRRIWKRLACILLAG